MKNNFLTRLPIAHRGLHDENLPENSLAAYDAAAKRGYAVETDVRLSKDGELFIFHDDTLARMTGDERKFIDCTAAEINELLLEGKEKIPTLGEFLACVDGRVPILLEVKNVPERDTREFLMKIAAAFVGYEGEYAMQSFNPAYVKTYKKLCPEIACGLLATAHSSKRDFNGSPFWRAKAFAVKHMIFNRYAKPDFISYAFGDYARNRAAQKFHGLKLGWTVRSPEDEVLAREYCDNIIFEGYLAEK